MQDERRTEPGDGLDKLIETALHVETDGEALRRLENAWTVLAKQQRRKQVALWTVPLAAAILLAVFLSSGVWPARHAGSPAAGLQDTVAERQRENENKQVAEVEQSSAERISAGREPTPYERIMFIAKTPSPATGIQRNVKLDLAIDQLAADGEVDAQQQLEAFPASREWTETQLLRKLKTASDSRKKAMIRLLAVCGSQRSVPALLRCGQQDSQHDECLDAIEAIVGLDNLAQVVRTTADQQLRISLMHRLLDADTDAGLQGYLLLVAEEPFRLEALSVADEAATLPIGRLIADLDHEQKSVRVAAALVLGHTNGPEVTRRLIDRVSDRPSHSAEAWLALLACRGELANEFFAQIPHQPHLLGHFNYARLQWSQIATQ